jgi:hypothetical protein
MAMATCVAVVMSGSGSVAVFLYPIHSTRVASKTAADFSHLCMWVPTLRHFWAGKPEMGELRPPPQASEEVGKY